MCIWKGTQAAYILSELVGNTRPVVERIGSLSNHDDSDKNVKRKNRFYEQNKSSARASRFLVHFFDVYCTPTTRFIQDVDIRP